MAVCAACGQENRPDARFCDSCGAALTALEPERELRKVVTVLFCDVTGSTAMGERLDSESLRKVMERYFAAARAALERHGGTVEKFIGDAVMAVFGVPAVHEDDALRAARAAVDLRGSLGALNAELRDEFGIELDIRTGINTGEVVTGTGGTLATGDAVNVAARLEQAAEPGEILIGESTRVLAEGALELEPAAPIDAKGKSEPVAAYRLLGVRRDAPAFARRFDVPFVGRRSELAQLEQAYERAVGDRACHLFTILGSAGIGKSRLTAEFLAHHSDAFVLRGRCIAYGEGITYFPLVEILEQIASDSDARALAEREADVLNRVAAAVGLAEGLVVAREEAFNAVRRLFEAIAAARPLIVVFDDIHWAEPTFLDLIDHLVDWSRGAPIFALCMARPDLLDKRPNWGGGKLNATTTLLEPLSADASDELVENLLEDVSLPNDLRRRIVETADGNPLFVEQMLALAAENGANGDLEVPPTIQALLATRLEQLPTHERVAAERASVIGKEFWRGAVTELGGEATALPPLVRKELIRPVESVIFPLDDAFRFRHLLIRDAAYDGMPKELRATLHERFARWLEDHRSEYDEIVGYHLEQAYRLREQLGPVDDVGRALAARAGEILGRAGQRAYDRSDVSAAANLLGRATELLPSTAAGRAALLADLGYALQDGGDLERALAVFAAAAEAGVSVGDEAVVVRAQIGALWAGSHKGGEADPAAIEEKLRVLERLGDDRGLAQGLFVLGTFRAWSGQSEAGARAYEQSRERGRALGSSRLGTISLGVQRLIEAWGYLPSDEGVAQCNALLKEHRGTLVEGFIFGARAIHRSLLGDDEGALADAARARELEREFGLELQAAAGWMTVADHELRFGRAAEAERAARVGTEVLERLGETGYFSTTAGMLAEALYRQARYDEAEQLAEQVRGIAGVEDFDAQVRWRTVLAKVLAQRGESAEAQELCREAIAIVAETDWMRMHADALVDYAEVLTLASKDAEAVATLRKALPLYERKRARVDAARAQRRIDEIEQ